MKIALAVVALHQAALVGSFCPNLHSKQHGAFQLFERKESSNSVKRRDVIAQGIALSTLLIGSPAISETPKTILITGANSGIGFEACKRLASSGHNIILACRTLEKAKDAISRIGTGNLIPEECDLADSSSIKQFAEKLQDSKIDTLCLNAGLARNTAAKDCARTKDGFELTVGTNYFGHFYLNHLLLPKISKTNGRIVVTASSVHDPESPGGKQGAKATLGDLSGLEQLGRDCEMIDGGEFNADKAYKDSKLCSILFMRELQRRLDKQGSTITANAFSPGLIVGSGFFRDQNPVFTKVFDVAATNVFKVGETKEWGGGCLAYMTTVNSKGQYWNSDPGSSKYGDDAYGKQFKPMEVSKEAQDAAKGQRLWELSAKALGIPT